MPTVADDSGLEVARSAGARSAQQAMERPRGSRGPGARRREQSAAPRRARRRGAIARASICVRGGVSSTIGARSSAAARSTGTIVDAAARTRMDSATIRTFLSRELGRTFGEASAAEKERVSHRGRRFAR